MSNDIMFQTFKKDLKINGQEGELYNYLKSKVQDISESGISLVWLPPSSKSWAQNYVGYTPMDYYDLGEFRQWIMCNNGNWHQHQGTATLHGTKNQLLGLINEFKSNNVKCIADIVINHRGVQQKNSQGEWCSWAGNEHTISSEKMTWGHSTNDINPEEIIKEHGGGQYRDSGENRFGTNIAHDSPSARQDIKDWMNWMKNDIGFQGWRYDYVKGFDPKFVSEYNYHTGNIFSVGEFWDGNTQAIYDWIDKTDADVNKRSKAFDFPLRTHLKDIFSGFKDFHKLGLWKHSNFSITGGWPEKSVTFLCNHDTDGEYFPKDKKRLLQGYSFLLTHPGIPCIYWKHFYEEDSSIHDMIKELCKYRKRKEILSNSNVRVLMSTNDCYVAKVDNRIIVKIGDGQWNPGNGWNLAMYDEGWAIWDL